MKARTEEMERELEAFYHANWAQQARPERDWKEDLDRLKQMEGDDGWWEADDEGEEGQQVDANEEDLLVDI